MPSPTFTLSPCTPTDVPGMAAVYTSAFAHDHFARYCLPPSRISSIELNRWLTSRFTKLFSSPEIRVFKIVDSKNGRLVAFARWSVPYVFSEAETAVREQEKKEMERRKRETGNDGKWPEGADLEVCELKFGPLNRRRERVIDEDDTYVCHLLAVHEDYWRQGLGGVLLKHVLDLADAEGKKAWIEATAAGRPLYAKFGFKEVDPLVEVDLSRWGATEPGRNWGMLREPQQKA